MTERTISAEERLLAWADDIQLSNQVGVPHYANVGELKADVRRLSAWVSGDVARAREIAKEIERGGMLGWKRQALAAEIVSLLTPPEEGE